MGLPPKSLYRRRRAAGLLVHSRVHVVWADSGEVWRGPSFRTGVATGADSLLVYNGEFYGVVLFTAGYLEVSMVGSCLSAAFCMDEWSGSWGSSSKGEGSVSGSEIGLYSLVKSMSTAFWGLLERCDRLNLVDARCLEFLEASA